MSFLHRICHALKRHALPNVFGILAKRRELQARRALELRQQIEELPHWLKGDYKPGTTTGGARVPDTGNDPVHPPLIGQRLVVIRDGDRFAFWGPRP